MYDLIKRIFLKKKLWESSALRVEATKKAEAEAKLAADKVANTKVDEEQQSEQRAREAAVVKADEIRAELNKLFINVDGSAYSFKSPDASDVHGGYSADLLRLNALNALEFKFIESNKW